MDTKSEVPKWLVDVDPEQSLKIQEQDLKLMYSLPAEDSRRQA